MQEEELNDQEMLYWKYHDDRYPTNGSRIVLCVSTNSYNVSVFDHKAANWNVLPEAVPIKREWCWGTPELPYPDGVPVFVMDYWLSSWHDTPKNQELTTYLTNAVAFLHTDRNWTNYYELCRSGMTSTNTHISKHAKADMINLFYSASNEQFQHMRNDPLLPDAFKNPYIDYLLANPRDRFEPWDKSPPVPGQ